MLLVGGPAERMNRWTRTMALHCSSQWKRRLHILKAVLR
ncbi:hypothetical protein M514_14287 [Trichuris suis]|uniref:Uncharacterized protein n=1 Tax=Trichuris suis TaxID=68888 RepID=A0A085MPU3_9BILA|nr:hypothetical protein M513_14287 [Trichuris suis]KFD59239.1 hypothetical protein M514_14287 [Trichuris suis]